MCVWHRLMIDDLMAGIMYRVAVDLGAARSFVPAVTFCPIDRLSASDILITPADKRSEGEICRAHT